MHTLFERLHALLSKEAATDVPLARGIFRAKRRRTLIAAGALGATVLGASSPVGAAPQTPPVPTPNAQPSQTGAPVLARASAAWGRGEFDVAEALFREALEEGGLSRNDTLRAYVYLASACAVQGKREQSLSAFRQAVLIDPSFAMPAEAGKKAVVLGEQVRAHEGHGAFLITAEIPAHATSGAPFNVRVTMDASRAALLTKVGLTVSGDGSSSYQVAEDIPQTPASENTVRMNFEVPARMATPGSELHVKIAGLDPHANELVTSEGHVAVDGAGVAAVAAHPSQDDSSRKKGGFWSSPIPYIIGGVALAGAGVGIYFATRPSDDVTITSVRVQSQ